MLFLLFFQIQSFAQTVIIPRDGFPYCEPFTKSTFRANTEVGGNPNPAFLTSGAGDPVDNGFLRLTDNSTDERGYVFIDLPFSSAYGLKVSFEYFAYGGIGPAYADGISFFMFDGSITPATFQIGGLGGSLGYSPWRNNASTVTQPGLKGAYFGLGFDAFRNWGNEYEGRYGGFKGSTLTGIGPVPDERQYYNTIAIRGPESSNYQFIDGRRTFSRSFLNEEQPAVWLDPINPIYYLFNSLPPLQYLDRRFTIGSTSRAELCSEDGYRKVFVDLAPTGTGTYLLTVNMLVNNGGTLRLENIFNNVPYNFPAPKNLKIGFAASTGTPYTNFHEIRNVTAQVSDYAAIPLPEIQNLEAEICEGEVNLFEFDVTLTSENSFVRCVQLFQNNPGTPNNTPPTGGDPALNNCGLSNVCIEKCDPNNNSITLPGKGTFTVELDELTTDNFEVERFEASVKFEPVAGFVGTAQIYYQVLDNYGLLSFAKTITVVANPIPVLSDTGDIDYPSCDGQDDGRIFGVVFGDLVTGYDYNWTYTDPSNTVFNLGKTGASVVNSGSTATFELQGINLGTYTLTVSNPSDSGGCPESVDILVDQELGTPVTINTPDEIICEGETVSFVPTISNPSGSPKFLWYLEADRAGGVLTNGTTTIDGVPVQVTIAANGQLTLVGLTSAGATPKIYDFFVEVESKDVPTGNFCPYLGDVLAIARVEVFPIPEVTFTQGNISCYNGSDGKITSVGTPIGSGPFQYQLFSLPGNTLIGTRTDGNFTGLTAGDYKVIVENTVSSCEFETITYSLTQPPALVPTFNQVLPICAGESFALPNTSNNGITGTWSPALNTSLTTTYTFTPASGVCAETATMTVTVNPKVIPTFNQVLPICAGDTFTLPTTSNNSIAGTWSPAINTSATTTYTFTPAAGTCAETATMTVTVNPKVVPTFNQVLPICAGDTFTLPATSNNSIAGTWSPAINTSATTTYTFTPAAGACAETATMTVTVNPKVVPTFTQVPDICAGDTFTLPTTSNNSIAGTWSPAINTSATTTYTFTPAAGTCATTATMTVTVNPKVVPTFNQVLPICAGDSFTLPATSNNSIAGTWSPAINTSATTTYTFTPAAGTCAETATMTVTVNPKVVPTFTQVPDICAGDTFTLPTTSLNGITGTWSPAINTTATTTYTFIPAAGVCAEPTTLTVTVNPKVVPVFTQVPVICEGDVFTLPTTSLNGITGTWSPAINTVTTTTYTFSPGLGQCADPTTMTVMVNPKPAKPVATVDCSAGDGAGVITVSSPLGSNFDYSKDGGTTYQASPVFASLANGTYTIRVRDKVTGCESEPTSVDVSCGCPAPATLVLSTDSGTTCETTAITVSGNTFGGSATNVSLTHDGTGTLNSASFATSPFSFTYTPGAGDGGKTVLITLITNDPDGSGTACSAVTRIYSLTVTKKETPVFTPVPVICEGDVFTLPTTSLNGIAGTWSPAINTTATTTYTFTPAAGVCAEPTTLTVTVNPKVVPVFTQVPVICEGDVFTLPTTSLNGITGTWSPAINTSATTTYTFTPTAGICANPATMTVTVNPKPAKPVATVDCSAGDGAGVITVSSPSGSNFEYSKDGGTTYQASPVFAGLANGTYPIRVRDKVTGCESELTSVDVNCGCPNPATLVLSTDSGTTCETTAITVSGNTFGGSATNVSLTHDGTGTLNSASFATSPFSFTYTPGAGDGGKTVLITLITNDPDGSGTACFAVTRTYSLTVTKEETPVFTQVPVICEGDVFTLPTTSLNGITGTWSPAIDNTKTTIYTFTPVAGECAEPTTMTVTVNPKPAKPVVATEDCAAGNGLAVITVSSPSGSNFEYSKDGGTTYQASPVFAGLANGTYTIRVRDKVTGCESELTSVDVNCGCPTPATLVLSTDLGTTCETTAITVSGNTFGGSATNVSLTHDGTGTLNSASFATSPFSFTYTPGAGDGGKTVLITLITNDPDGSGTACSAVTRTYSLTVTKKETPVFTPVPVICEGDVFTLSTTSLNGIAGTWSPAIDNTKTTIYTFTPVAGECAEPTTMTVTVNPKPAKPVVATVDCAAGNGLAVITVSSPSGSNFEYSKDGGTTYQASPVFASLANGTYTIRVRDKVTGCESELTSVDVNCGCVNPAFLDLFATSGTTTVTTAVTVSGNTFGGSATNVSLTHDGTGTLSSSSFATSPFSFTYTPGAGDADKIVLITILTDDPDGSGTLCSPVSRTYSLTVTNVVLPPLLADIITTPVTCFGGNDGSISIQNIQGGTPPFQFSIDGNTWQVSPIFTGLEIGTYTVYIKDPTMVNGASVSFANIKVETTAVPILSNTPDIINSSCDEANGAIRNLTITGGAGGFTFEWRKDDPNSVTLLTGGSLNGLENLLSGIYFITVTDLNGCKATFDFEIKKASVPVYELVPPIDACEGIPVEIKPIFIAPNPPQPTAFSEIRWYKDAGQSGLISNGPDSADPSVIYTIDDTDWLNPILKIENLPVGNHDFYFYVVCTGQEIKAEITVFEAPEVVFESDPVSCFGDANGKIRSISGTKPEYTYSVDGASPLSLTDLEALSLKAGTYDIEVITPAGCSQLLQVIVEGPLSELTLSSFTSIDPGCGAINGKIQAEITGGWAPYTVKVFKDAAEINTVILNGSDFFIDGLSTGVYSLEIIDAKGCKITSNKLTLVDGPTQIIVADQEICEGSPVTFLPSLDPPVSAATFQWFFDQAGTKPIISSPVPAADGFTYEISANGALKVNGLKYSAVPYQYFVSATGADVCVGFIADPQVIVNELPKITASISNEKCFGEGGVLTINATGGGGNYEYSIDGVNFQASNFFTLPTGTYTAYVRTAAGCPVTLPNLTISGPLTPISISNLDQDMATCGQEDGTIRFTVQGGYGDYEADLIRNEAVLMTSSAASDGSVSFSGLGKGNYSIQVRDSEGCQVLFGNVIDVEEIPTPISVQDQTICEGEIASLAPQVTVNSPDIKLTWYFDAAATNPISAGTIAGATYSVSSDAILTVEGLTSSASPYQFYVVAEGTGVCPSVEPAKVTVLPIAPLRVNNPAIVCDPTGTVDLTDWIEGFNPNVYDYNVISPLGSSLRMDELSAVNISGDYRVSSSLKGASCWNQEQRMKVIIADTLLEANFIFEIDLGGGNIVANTDIRLQEDVFFKDLTQGNVVKWDWSFGDGSTSVEQNPVHSYEEVGTYVVTLRTIDEIGCESIIEMLVNVIDDFKVIIPNAFTPGGNKNQYFRPQYRGIASMEFYIFNTWGELIYQTTSLEDLGWDGTLNGKDVPNGNYVYRGKFVSRGGEVVDKSGVFILIR